MSKNLSISFIIPVYNRPQEIRELLGSFKEQTYAGAYEIVIVEDGSSESAEAVISEFPPLPITYFFKANSGPGPSRNYGMQRARGNYFIILDSDCVLPGHYLDTVVTHLEKDFIDFFGGPDAAGENFDNLQKAISYTMTSLLTTGGIRGGGQAVDRFQPRSFNMGISKTAFEASGGFGKIHPGEDPDLTLRLWGLGYRSRLIPEAYVYHKRRITWKGFYGQVRKFGLVRPILNAWHPGSAKITYWFPSLFILGVLGSHFFLALGFLLPILCYLLYFTVLFVDASVRNGNPLIGLMAVFATLVQFTGYGLAFLESTYHIALLKKLPQKKYPHLFYE